MSRFAKSNGANNDELGLNSDDEDDNGNRHGSPEADSKRQQQHLSPASPDDRALRDGLAGLVAKGTPKTTTSPSSSSSTPFSDPLNKAKAASKTEKAWEGDAPRAQTMVAVAASQPRKMEDGVEEVALRMPGLSSLGITAMLPLMRRQGRVLGARESVAADAAEMKVRTRTPYASNFSPPPSIQI